MHATQFAAIPLLSGVILVSAIASAEDAAAGPQAGDLSTIMAGLSGDMARIQAGLWAEDLAAVSRAAGAIANHPRAGGTERLRILAAVGTDLGRFKEADGVVHDAAVRLSVAAARGDLDGSLIELATLQAGCVACHSSFRERLRD